MAPLGLNITEAAKVLDVARHTLSRVLNGHAAVSPEMAIRLEKAKWGSAEHWLRLQTEYDLAQARKGEDRINPDLGRSIRENCLDPLESMAREFEPFTRGLRELAARLEPLMQSLAAAAAPLAQAVERGRERWNDTEILLNQGWVPNHTTPFALVAECKDDDARLQNSLLAYYTDNWSEVRARLETRLASYGVDDESQATFQEALDAHETGLYRSVSRGLFPEIERVLRAALFNGRARRDISYRYFINKLTGEAANLALGDFLISGVQDMMLFKYLTEGFREHSASGDDSRSATPEYVPGLAVGVDETNVGRARQSPIPTRHAVVHGLVAYSSRQSSLNAIFIADYVFSVVSKVKCDTPDSDAR